ncbi:MAG TPA: acyltransferase [Fibrella sp.]
MQSPVQLAIDRYVPALTGIRAVAAYLVFIHHYNPAMPGTFAYRLLAQGYVGVSLFFVLSGFLIYHRYADRFFQQESWSWRTYLWSRFARIYPLYALLVLLTILSSQRTGHPMSASLISLNLTLTKGFFDDYKFTGIAQSWSLTVEECFYLLAPLLFVELRRVGPVWLSLSLIGMGVLLWLTIGHFPLHGFFGKLSFVSFYTFFGRSFEFVMGMWLARKWHLGQLRNRPFALLIGGVLLVSCAGWQAVVPTLVTSPTALIGSEIVSYNFLLPVAIGLLFISLLNEKTLISDLLAGAVLQGLGRSSYAFYLIHIGIVSKFMDRTMGSPSGWLRFLLMVLLAHGLYLLIEKPIHRWLTYKRQAGQCEL